MNTISREELKQHIDHGHNFFLLDALPNEDFSEGHLPGAISMPPEKVAAIAPKLIRDKDEMIVTYCGNENCPKSHMTAAALEKLGYTNVLEYRAGKQDWMEAGLPLDTPEWMNN